MIRYFYYCLLISCCLSSCTKSPNLTPVSVADFAQFVAATNYMTDAEQYGWSIVQQDVDNFIVLQGVDWRIPDGKTAAAPDYPVTQVSFNDAIAYCQWLGNARLPSYEEYWDLVANDKRPIVASSTEILANAPANIVGNVWEITTTEDWKKEIRLAGGSFLCNKNTCNGTEPSRTLYVDKATGNVHIGFAVLLE